MLLKNTVMLDCTKTQPRTLSPFANSTGSIQQYQQPTLRTSAVGPKILQAEKDTSGPLFEAHSKEENLLPIPRAFKGFPDLLNFLKPNLLPKRGQSGTAAVQ